MPLYLKCPTYHPNVGDVIAIDIARHFLTPEVLVGRRIPNDAAQDARLMAGQQENLLLVGSIAEWADARSHLCGVGLMASDSRMLYHPKKIHSVRGPLSRFFLGRLGIEAPERYGDPGLLMPDIFPVTSAEPVHDIGFIPHYLDKTLPVVQACREKGVAILDVFSPPAQFIAGLQSCRVLLSSSLHGIILAHAYGRPALWVQSPAVPGNGFKFFDYYLSLGVSPEKLRSAPLSSLENPQALAAMATLEPVDGLQSAIREALAGVKHALEL